MLVKRHPMHLEVEIVKWIILFTLAMAIALIVTSVAAGVPPKYEGPKPLPPEVSRLAKPLETAPPVVPPEMTDYQRAMELWAALDLHAEDPAAAREAWETKGLLPPNATWRMVAVGVTYLQTENPGKALELFVEAARRDGDNPVVHYCLGMTRLVQAEKAMQWYDAIGPENTRYVAYRGPGDLAPNTKSMYHLAAIMEFRKTLELMPNLDLGESLMGIDWVVPDEYTLDMPVATPTVGDLLHAVGAENVAGKSHHALGELYVVQGSLAMAEQHLDEAHELGLAVANSYRKLAKEYEREGKNVEAARAYMKALRRTADLTNPMEEVFKNLGKEMLGNPRKL